MNKTLYYLLFIVLVSGFLLTGCKEEETDSNITEETVQESDLKNTEDEAKGGEYPPEDESSVKENSIESVAPVLEIQPEPQPSTNYQTQSQQPVADATIYANGTYNLDGSYTSPAGNENISVVLSLDNDFITGVSVRPNSANATSKSYQEQFAAGVSAIVIGKKLDEISFGKVNGSSLTVNGFNVALASLKEQAKN